jgi:hypothetical protein
VGTPLLAHIGDVEAAMRELGEAKEKLEGLYAKEVAEKVHAYYEKQSRMALLSLQVKKELEAIESNYGTLIEIEDEGRFVVEQQKWEGLMESYKREAISEQDYKNSQGKILASIEEFYSQLEGISRFRIDIKMGRGKATTACDEFDLALTPIDGNSLSDTVTFDQLRLSLKPRGPLKLKTHKKLGTDREFSSSSQSFTKRNSLCGESHQQTIRRA